MALFQAAKKPALPAKRGEAPESEARLLEYSPPTLKRRVQPPTYYTPPERAPRLPGAPRDEDTGEMPPQISPQERFRLRLNSMLQRALEDNLRDETELVQLAQIRNEHHKQIDAQKHPWWKRMLLSAAHGIAQLPANVDTETMIGAGMAGAAIGVASKGTGNQIVNTIQKRQVDELYSAQAAEIANRMAIRQKSVESIKPILQFETAMESAEVRRLQEEKKTERQQLAIASREKIAEMNIKARQQLAENNAKLRKELADLRLEYQSKRDRASLRLRATDLLNRASTVHLEIVAVDELGNLRQIKESVPVTISSEQLRQTLQKYKKFENVKDEDIEAYIKEFETQKAAYAELWNIVNSIEESVKTPTPQRAAPSEKTSPPIQKPPTYQRGGVFRNQSK